MNYGILLSFDQHTRARMNEDTSNQRDVGVADDKDCDAASMLFNARQPVHAKVRSSFSANAVVAHTLEVLFSDRSGRSFFRSAAALPPVIQTSLAGAAKLHHTKQGFVGIASAAYNEHHALILRPDDVWQALVIQFSFYVQARAEALRDRMVDFQGKKKLVVEAAGTLHSVDHGALARAMVDQIRLNIRDPSVADWLLPSFSTTTANDRVVASISIMATMQAYFEYKFSLCCGIPSVHLLGTVADWELLHAKLERFLEFEVAPQAAAAAPADDADAGCLRHWVDSLRPVLAEMLATKRGADNMASFWDHILSTTGGGSGPRYISGWIRAFCAFTERGVYQGREENIDTSDIPSGVLSVPVTVDDNGVEHECTLVAGQMCASAAKMQGTALQPRSDWMLVQATTSIDEEDDNNSSSDED